MGANLEGAILGRANLEGAILISANLEGAIHLTYDQLKTVKTLYGVINLDPELEKKLKETHPQLFEGPKPS